MAKHIAVWPKVRVYVDGKNKIIDRGDPVPDGIAKADLANLVSFGAIVNVDALVPTRAASPDDAAPSDGKPTSVKDILAAVGDDQALAQQYLDEETAKGDDARPTLVEKLTAIAQPSGS